MKENENKRAPRQQRGVRADTTLGLCWDQLQVFADHRITFMPKTRVILSLKSTLLTLTSLTWRRSRTIQAETGEISDLFIEEKKTFKRGSGFPSPSNAFIIGRLWKLVSMANAYVLDLFGIDPLWTSNQELLM